MRRTEPTGLRTEQHVAANPVLLRPLGGLLEAREQMGVGESEIESAQQLLISRRDGTDGRVHRRPGGCFTPDIPRRDRTLPSQQQIPPAPDRTEERPVGRDSRENPTIDHLADGERAVRVRGAAV